MEQREERVLAREGLETGGSIEIERNGATKMDKRCGALEVGGKGE